MEFIHIDVEGFEPFEFDAEHHVTAGDVKIHIREVCRLLGGSVRQGLQAFLDGHILRPGDYVFNGFTVQGKCFSLTSIIYFYKIDLKYIGIC